MRTPFNVALRDECNLHIIFLYDTGRAAAYTGLHLYMIRHQISTVAKKKMGARRRHSVILHLFTLNCNNLSLLLLKVKFYKLFVQWNHCSLFAYANFLQQLNIKANVIKYTHAAFRMFSNKICPR